MRWDMALEMTRKAAVTFGGVLAPWGSNATQPRDPELGLGSGRGSSIGCRLSSLFTVPFFCESGGLNSFSLAQSLDSDEPETGQNYDDIFKEGSSFHV